MLNSLKEIYQNVIVSYIEELCNTPFLLVMSILDVVIVVFLLYKLFQMLKGTRAWQLSKGILLLILATFLSEAFHLSILNYILSSVMSYGLFMLIVIFQPEIRRALEQLGTNKFSKYFGIDDETNAKTKENIYKIAIAAMELSKAGTGALIVIERDIKIQDITSTGIVMNAEISPQVLVNIFEPKTPLHDGAVVISNNKIAAACCMLPLADDKDIARELGTRHRAAIGISKESDSIVVVVSEETGKVSIAKDGTLIADVREDVLKKILIKNLIVEAPKAKKKEKKKVEQKQS